MIHDLFLLYNVSYNDLLCRREGWTFTECVHMVLQCQSYCQDGWEELVMYACEGCDDVKSRIYNGYTFIHRFAKARSEMY